MANDAVSVSLKGPDGASDVSGGSQLERAAALLNRLGARFSGELLVIPRRAFRKALKVAAAFLDFVKAVWSGGEAPPNADLDPLGDVARLQRAGACVSPVRLDFLRNASGEPVLIDVNLPGSLVPELFWPLYSALSRDDGTSGASKGARLDPLLALDREATRIAGPHWEVHRFLDVASNKPAAQRRFLERVYDFARTRGLAPFHFHDVDVASGDWERFNSTGGTGGSKIASVFLNTHNSPRNLLESCERLLATDLRVFADPHLLWCTDKRPADLETLECYLPGSRAEFLAGHLPRVLDSTGGVSGGDGEGSLAPPRPVLKRRLGHAGSGLASASGPSGVHPHPTVLVEGLRGFQGPRPGWEFEVSVSALLVAEGLKLDVVLPVGLGAKGAPSHPVSGPEATLFPTITEELAEK